MEKLDLKGQRYHKLIVLESVESIEGRSAWKCQCDCGIIKIIKTENLRNGDTKSCGCWNNEQRSSRSKKMYSKVIKYTPMEATAHSVWRKNYGEMSYEDFYTASQQECYYCGAPPSNEQNIADNRSSQNMKDNGSFIYSGLDRLDSSLPHSRENCVACCKYCNYAKRERTVEEFKSWIIRVHDFFAKIQE